MVQPAMVAPPPDLTEDDRAAVVAATPLRRVGTPGDVNRLILYLRFFRGMTQRRIADQLGISQMHVSRLLSACFDRLREELLAEAG